jgi:hypothetical protein
MELKQILAIIGGLIGLVIVLAAIFDWPIIPVPSDHPQIGPGRHHSKETRLKFGIVGAILVVAAIVVLST